MVFRILSSTDPDAADLLFPRRPGSDRALVRRVAGILADVRRNGDRALVKYARRFDGLNGPLEIPLEEVRAAARRVGSDVREAIRVAASHIKKIAKRQVPRGWRTETIAGVSVEQRVTPLDRVGCYVPGGRHPLPSSLLMSVIPARMAGVAEVVVACPSAAMSVMAAAVEADATRVFQMGGAHAIAAMAYGTETVPAVDKIVGPGNAYVATAKELVSRDCGIDFFAGPSEILIVTRDGNPAWIAADLVAQAEHDPDARAILVTPNRPLANEVQQQVEALLSGEGPARQSLSRHGGAVVVRDMAEAVALANRVAAEHVVCDSEAQVSSITAAGAVFVGPYSAQASGDYTTGSNHILPTGGAARARGGLSAADFVRVSSIQRLTREGLSRLAPHAVALARAEGLEAHAASIETRLKGAKTKGPKDTSRS